MKQFQFLVTADAEQQMVVYIVSFRAGKIIRVEEK